MTVKNALLIIFMDYFLFIFNNYIMLVKKIIYNLNIQESHGSLAIVEGVAFKIGLVDGN